MASLFETVAKGFKVYTLQGHFQWYERSKEFGIIQDIKERKSQFKVVTFSLIYFFFTYKTKNANNTQVKTGMSIQYIRRSGAHLRCPSYAPEKYILSSIHIIIVTLHIIK